MDKKKFRKSKVYAKMAPGEVVKILRELQSLSQKELAELTGIAQSNISALETGTREIGRERALALGLALKVHPAVILFPDFDITKIAA